jgi:hypothetical protein
LAQAVAIALPVFAVAGGAKGGAKLPKFPTKVSNFRHTPQFAIEKTVFSPLLDQNFRKFVNFPEGGGGGGRPRPTKISATGSKPSHASFCSFGQGKFVRVYGVASVQ